MSTGQIMMKETESNRWVESQRTDPSGPAISVQGSHFLGRAKGNYWRTLNGEGEG